MKYAWLSPIASAIWSVICSLLWCTLTTAPLEIISSYFSIVMSFTLSAFIEGLAEPFAILCMKLGENAHYAIGQSMLVFLQKFFVLFFILFLRIEPITAFCVAQIAASLSYFFFYAWKMLHISFVGIWPRFSGYERKHLEILRSITIHSVMKQLLTEGAGFVMSFTNLLTLKQQAVYDAVERLGSLVARIILAPLEESASNYFQANLKREGTLP
uniref:Protein RFT1 homolog n=1 Tax=Acrobeloides nanus TaxID=290746 RepID=A0A914CXN1_9BILA